MRNALAMIADFTLAAVLTLVAGTAPANAWTWDPTVTVTGNLNQCGNLGAQAATVYADLNGERHIQHTLVGQPPTYKITFGSVPSGGGWAWFVVDCVVSGESQGHWVWVYRPAWGSTIHANL